EPAHSAPLAATPVKHRRPHVAVAASETTAAVGPAAPLPSPAVALPIEPQKDGQLTVAITPWCDLSVDDKPRGRAPLTLTLPPGNHQLECRQPSGAAIRRTIVIEPGKNELWREKLFAAARISPQLKTGSEFSVDDGAKGATAREAMPGRHRIT